MTEKLPEFSSKPDFTYWCKMPVWELEEAIALSLDLDPEIVSWNFVQSSECPSDLRRFYQKQRGPIIRASESGVLPRSIMGEGPRVKPGEFLDWAKSNEIDYPMALEDAMKLRGRPITDWKSEYDRLKAECDTLKAPSNRLDTGPSAHKSEEPLGALERKSLLKLVIGMAVGRYRYDPKVKRSDTPKRILTDVEKLGLHIGDDTVRKWLGESAKMLAEVLASGE